MNNGAIKISIYTHLFWPVSRPELNQIEYASITRPFPLKSRREGKVKQSCYCTNEASKQSFAWLYFTRDSLIVITTCIKPVTRFIQTSPSVNLKSWKSAVLIICAPNAISQWQLTVYKLTVFSFSVFWWKENHKWLELRQNDEQTLDRQLEILLPRSVLSKTSSEGRQVSTGKSRPSFSK